MVWYLSPENIKSLLQAAETARLRAYAPYSRYKVGAAVMDAQAQIYSGCNIENASYSMTLCAERVAYASAHVAGIQKPVAWAVIADNNVKDLFVTPCGACRQFMNEFNPDAVIYIAKPGAIDNYKMFKLNELLPQSFSSSNLS